jgi:hypothetical protein
MSVDPSGVINPSGIEKGRLYQGNSVKFCLGSSNSPDTAYLCTGAPMTVQRPFFQRACVAVGSYVVFGALAPDTLNGLPDVDREWAAKAPKRQAANITNPQAANPTNPQMQPHPCHPPRLHARHPHQAEPVQPVPERLWRGRADQLHLQRPGIDHPRHNHNRQHHRRTCADNIDLLSRQHLRWQLVPGL